MLCDELEEEYLWTNNVKTPSTRMVRAYNADEVDEAIAELKARIQLDDDEMAGFLDLEEECGGGDLRNYIAELKAENERLNNALDKERSETIKYMDELCNAKNEIERLTIDKRNAEQRADVADATSEKLKADNECLKQKLEDAKASHYAEMVDAGMRERRLCRALWLTRALRARDIQRWWLQVTCSPRTGVACMKWNNAERKCRAKAEEYK